MTAFSNVGRVTPADPFGPSGAGSARGDIRFVSAEERTGLHGAITPRGLLAVEIGDPPWFQTDGPVSDRPVCPPVAGTGAKRGKLREAIDWAIESALDTNGAPPAGLTDIGDLDQSLSDQLYRARTVGARGLALYFPHLAAAGSLAGALDAEDSAVLRWWMAATSERPVVLLLDAANGSLGAYGPPTRLERLVEAARGASKTGSDRAPQPSDPVAVAAEVATAAAVEVEIAVEPPGQVAAIDDPYLSIVTVDADANTKPPAAETLTAAIALDPPADPDDDETSEPPHAPDHAPHPPAPSAVAAMFGARAARPPVTEARHKTIAADDPMTGKSVFANRVVPLFPRREVLPARSPSFVEKGTAVAASLDWRGFANELEVARGPKPLTIVERLFMSRYVPLMDAVVRGEADDAAKRTAERWADNFSRSYTEAFSALKITGRRPRMVLDVPQLASQIARLHGAKSIQLVLVDAMRFDVGLRVHDRMRDELTSQATCTERLLFWSALPTTTPTQLDLLARGPEGLASRSPPSDREEPALRGRTATTLRRIRAGNRDMLKIDVIESRLRESGPPLAERLDAAAEEVAGALSTHARSLAPRTLMFVFGDHGFRMESSEAGTLPGTSGGSSPEEVLVPAFAWLVGDVH